MTKAALYGGAFNPVHYGHLRIAEEVREALALEKVIFMPLFNPPHKSGDAMVSPEARLEMLNAAIAANPGFEVSDMEIKRGGLSYTIETVRELIKGGIEPTVIMGSDQFNVITSWCAYEELILTADIAVVGRPGVITKKVAEALPVELARKFWYDNKSGAYRTDAGRAIYFVDTTPMEISSSAIRALVKEGRSIKYLVPEAVAKLISSRGFYKKGD
ncbi:MAG: nicotinate-nucleotide adenylyltransferase [Deltaproteobacteria bacterium]|nr:nicotinate-nucleotide adenylyltransferase [Deltaproteobacteria bacterium]